MRYFSTLTLALTAIACVSCGETGPEPQAAVRGPVSFYRERVVVEPSENRTRVVGDYYFRNTTDDSVSLAISYPFPVDLRHARPFRVGAWLVNDQERRPLGFHNVSDAITWRMAFEPRAEKHVQVEYVQRIAGKHAVYIVTTTSLWGEPIEVAEFEFRVPASLGGHRLSFEPDRAETRGDTVVYSMKRTDFMPDSDLEIWW